MSSRRSVGIQFEGDKIEDNIQKSDSVSTIYRPQFHAGAPGTPHGKTDSNSNFIKNGTIYLPLKKLSPALAKTRPLTETGTGNDKDQSIKAKNAWHLSRGYEKMRPVSFEIEDPLNPGVQNRRGESFMNPRNSTNSIHVYDEPNHKAKLYTESALRINREISDGDQSSSKPANTYYGNYIKIKNGKKQNGNWNLQYSLNLLNTVVVILTGITIIALNIGNIGLGTAQKTMDEKMESKLSIINAKLDDIIETLDMGIKPKIDLLDKGLTYSIPSKLTSMGSKLTQNFQSIMDAVEEIQRCDSENHTGSSEQGSSKPIVNVTVDDDQNRYDTDANGGPEEHIELLDYPKFKRECDGQYVYDAKSWSIKYLSSFIPDCDFDDCCTREPSLQIKKNHFTYTHEIRNNTCKAEDKVSQLVMFGTISPNQRTRPSFLINTIHYIDDINILQTCHSIGSVKNGVILCTIGTVGAKTLIRYPRKVNWMSVTINERGDRRYYFYNLTSEKFRGDVQMKMMIPHSGGGIIVNDTLFTTALGVPAYQIEGWNDCPLKFCEGSKTNTLICKESIGPKEFNNNQVLDLLVKIKHPFHTNWSAEYHVIGIEDTTVGSKCKLYLYNNRLWIYKSPISWDSYVKFGEVLMNSNLNVKWQDNSVLSRPGEYPCQWGNRCPSVCITGSYNEALSPNVRFPKLVSLFLNSTYSYVKPTLGLFYPNRTISSVGLNIYGQSFYQSVLNCVTNYGVVWCLGVIEYVEDEDSYVQLKALTFKIPNTCKSGNPKPRRETKEQASHTTHSPIALSSTTREIYIPTTIPGNQQISTQGPQYTNSTRIEEEQKSTYYPETTDQFKPTPPLPTSNTTS